VAARGGAGLPGPRELWQQDLKEKKYRPVYVLAGEDTLRIEKVVATIRDDALGAAAGFNYHVVHGDQADMGRVLQTALALPMLAGVQVIWVKRADALLGQAAGQESFEKYLADPPKETILILSMDRLDKRRKWAKAALAAGYVFDFSPPQGQELVRWVVQEAKRADLPLGDDHARILCELVGADPLALKSEIDKLALMAADRGGSLEADDLERLIMDQAELEGYEITAHLAPGGAPEVLRTWYRLRDWGRSAYEIAPLVLARVRRAAVLGAARSAGMADQEIARRTAQNPWSFRYFEPMLRGLGDDGLRDALRAAGRCDRLLKSSPLKPDIILETTLAEICARREPRR
jgi:DNA polymerase-3 subunit delta